MELLLTARTTNNLRSVVIDAAPTEHHSKPYYDVLPPT